MPVSSRSSTSYLTLVLVLCLFAFLSPAAAAPAEPIIDTSPDTGNLTVFDPDTKQPIPQFPASDAGSGRLVTILWIIFGLVVGGPLGVFGLRSGRLCTGAACGLTGVVTIWAAFVNSLSTPLSDTPATADLIFTLILFATFVFLTFLGSYLHAMHPIGLGLVGAVGGTSFFMRIVIFKGGLLIPIYPLNLALLGVGAIMGGISICIVWRRRLSVMVSTSLISTFLVGLSLDLVLNMNAPQQQGMSRGLRLLMDRNSAHLADIVGIHYEPTIKTQALLGASLGLVPVLAYLQHRLFPGPFTYDLRRSQDDAEREYSLYENSPDWSAGRPLGVAGKGVADLSRMPISGPMFGAVGHGSRFST